MRKTFNTVMRWVRKETPTTPTKGGMVLLSTSTGKPITRQQCSSTQSFVCYVPRGESE